MSLKESIKLIECRVTIFNQSGTNTAKLILM